MQRLYTKSQAKKELGISTYKLEQYLNTYQIPVVLRGRMVYLRQSEIDELKSIAALLGKEQSGPVVVAQG